MDSTVRAPAPPSSRTTPASRRRRGAGVTAVVSPVSPGTPKGTTGDGPQLPHERDQALGSGGSEPREVIAQAGRDLQAGMVDTDLHATPGLDAAQRDKLVKRER